MVFSSILFLIFALPIFLLVYFLVPRKGRNITLLITSIFFYAWGAPEFLYLLLFSTGLNFFIVKKLSKTSSESQRKKFLWLSIILNIGLLLVFKYGNFVVFNVNEALRGLKLAGFGMSEILLPIGISFFTFQSLSYTIDVYRKSTEPFKSLVNYMVYILSFPQMIAGPIVRFGEVAAQVIERRSTIEDRLHGFIRFSIGLGKKCLLANALGEYSEFMLNEPLDALNGPIVIWGMLCYTFQIYFDFAGYSDMAIGLGRMMGFRFPENFNNPYISKSITEFWRRWHITLSSWMRDYLYVPLGGNRRGVSRTYINLAVVFVISGLWHGAAWQFIVWGIYHGVFLVLDRLFLIKVFKKLKIVALPLTFAIVLIGWIPFASNDMSHAWDLFLKMFSGKGDILQFPLQNSLITVLTFSVVFSLFNITSLGQKVHDWVYNPNNTSNKFFAIMIPVAIVLWVFSVSSIASGEYNPFIYFRF